MTLVDKINLFFLMWYDQCDYVSNNFILYLVVVNLLTT